MTNKGDVVPFRTSADAHAQTESDRKRALFAWADSVLQQIGLTTKIEQAKSLNALNKIVFDPEDIDVAMAIDKALRKPRDEHFVDVSAGMLKRLLKKQFDDQKKARQAELLVGNVSGQTGTARQQNNAWINELKLHDKTGAILPILKNLILFLCNYPDWKDVLGFNEFAAQVTIRKRPYWGDVEPDAIWTDHYETLTRSWFQDQDIPASQGDVGRAIQAAARKNSFHPLRTYLEEQGLQWDDRQRADRWMITYLHAPDTPYIRAVGPRFLISAVARIFEPGCKVDHVPILEGPQGQGKSKAVRALAVHDEYYTDRLSNPSSKDAAIETAGVWFIEIAELHALLTAKTSATKAYITRQSERYRPPYGKHPIKRKRQCVYVGTINPPSTGYLEDSTGSRRLGR